MGNLGLSASQLSYLAGIVDGEGTIGIRFLTESYCEVRFSVSNTNADLLFWFRSFLTGFGSFQFVKGKPNTKSQWRFTAVGNNAEKILTAIHPFLVSKQKQADLALAVLNSRPKTGNKSTLERLQLCKQIVDQNTMLNHRGAGGGSEVFPEMFSKAN